MSVCSRGEHHWLMIPRHSTFQLWPLPLAGRALVLGEYGGLGFPMEAAPGWYIQQWLVITPIMVSYYPKNGSYSN
jgi:hypothetical protein